MSRSSLTLLILISFLCSCIQAPNQYTKLPPGEWRAILKLSDNPNLDEGPLAELGDDEKVLDYFELPFNFTVNYTEDGSMFMEFKNDKEKILIEDIHYGRDPATAKDTLKIQFLDFDTSLEGFYEDNFIEGYWKVPYRGDNYKIPFLAQYGNKHRFNIIPEDQNYDFSGRWKVIFEFDSDDAYTAIAEFYQDGHDLSGTFITETGDYRFLQGNANGNKMQLSVFDGSHAFLFEARNSADTLVGEFRSGAHYKCNWMATRDDEYELKDPFDMTHASSPEAIDFSFEDLNGKVISLSDEKFKGKIKLLNIMGTWCPNCKDEILFLKEFQKDNPDIEILSLAFERYRENEKSIEVIKRYKEKLNIDWTMLYGGYANKKAISEQLEFLDKFYSYPTLLLIDDKNVIRGIQTGFYGPATSKHEEFKEEFYSILESVQSK